MFAQLTSSPNPYIQLPINENMNTAATNGTMRTLTFLIMITDVVLRTATDTAMLLYRHNIAKKYTPAIP